MLRKFKILMIGLVLAVFLPAGILHAQKIDNLDLQFNHTGDKRSKIVPVPGNDEFKLSLGSQLFAEEESRTPRTLPTTETSRINIAEGFSDFGSINIERFQPLDPSQLNLRTSSPTEQRRFLPTITLSSAYEDNSIGLNGPDTESISIGGTSGRLSVYGKFEQQHMTTFNTPESSALGETVGGNAIRASIVDSENNGQKNPEPYEKSAALASKYYLEAVYSFKPTLKGKVSFKRSMIDTFESEEKLQVEGIVDANRNVQIKAGYKNEVRPEVTDTKSSKNTKVWTEFILKF
ncbi:MAG: hypothetical protein KKB51_07660 [Candidatus Riflebacteria bacterium]|nr:hypothetical protein [Candidatus Riflebacteria bacterium]